MANQRRPYSAAALAAALRHRRKGYYSGPVRSFGTFEAKNRLCALLDLVASGEEIIITRHGWPIARLVGCDPADRVAIVDAVAQLKAIREQNRLDSAQLRHLQLAERRY